MDEPYAVGATHTGILTAAKSVQEKTTESSSGPVSEGIRCAQKIAKISVITLLSIGIVELLIGQISGSVVATADGIDSVSDAMISFIVFMGLVIADRPADMKFHFGYYKVESFAALIAAKLEIISCSSFSVTAKVSAAVVNIASNNNKK